MSTTATLEAGAASPQAPAVTAPRSPAGARRAARWRRVGAPMVLLGAWVAGSVTGLIPARLLPGPATVAGTAWRLLSDGSLEHNLVVSLGRVAVGLGLGVAAGTALALAAGLTRRGDDLIDPNMQMLRTLPVLALVPLFIVWFGIGQATKVYMIAFATTFPVYLNLYSGIRGADQKLIESGRSLGLSGAGLVRHVILPGAMAPFLVGLRIAAGVSWLVLVVCEQINATSGIGYLMSNAEDFYRTDIIVVGLITYALLGLVTDALVRTAERRALLWRST